MAVITPYDNKIGVWMVHGKDVGEATIDDIGKTIQTYAPAINAFWVKTSDGSDWMSTYDSKPSMWIDGVGAVDKWVNTLQRYGIEFHAWCVPRGIDLDAEADKIIQVCQRPGVRSMVLDVEPYNGFWKGGKDKIRPFMLKIRSAIPGSFHIGMSVDARKSHYAEIFPAEWFPFVNSIHPQVYWPSFQNTPQKALGDAYDAWGQYGKPVIPVLYGFNCPTTEIDTARTLAITQYQAQGVSYWAFGHIDATHFVPINYSMQNKPIASPPGANGSPVQTGTPTTVNVGSPNYQDGVYDPAHASFGTYSGANGIGKYRPTDQGVANAWAIWNPKITTAGWYRIEAYVAARPRPAGNARYRIRGVKDRPDEHFVTVAQSAVSNGWVTVGTFYLESTRQNAGLVTLTDWTFELGREIIFDAIRWTPLTASTQSKMIDVPYRSQEDPDARRYRNDCGPACIAMYIDYVRQRRGQPPQPISINDLAAQTSLAQVDNGLTTSELVTLAARYNITLTQNSSLDINAIIEEVRNDRPPLMLIKYGALLERENQADQSGHFVIVVGYDPNYLYLNDPDWWNQPPYTREMGHNWRVPISQFRNAIQQASPPTHGLKLTV